MAQFEAIAKTCHHVQRTNCGKGKVSAQRGKIIFTKWHDKRDISFLSTNVLPSKPSRLAAWKKNGLDVQIEKPCVADVYKADMGGVDRADQLQSFYFAGYSSQKWYRYNFWFLFNLSVCNSFILKSIYYPNQREQKQPMIFRLDLAKQLINGVSQRKGKQKSQETLNQPVACKKHISGHVQGRKSMRVQCIQAGRRTMKGHKVEMRV